MSLLRMLLMANTPKDYIKFADPVVEKICAENWGDGIGITYAQAARVKTLGNKFQGNTEITSFNEFQYFGCTYTEMNEFNGCTALNEITIPDSLKTLKDNSFNGTALTEIDCKNVSSFGTYVFANCSLLKKAKAISFSPSTYNNGGGAFMNCGALESIELGKMTQVPYSIFQKCALLTLPDGFFDGVKMVNWSAFDGCTNIDGDLALNDCAHIGQYSFRNTSITSIDLPMCTEDISGAFYNCKSLKYANLPLIKKIDFLLFYNCSELETVTLDKEKITSIGSQAFQNCIKLKMEIDFPNVTTISGDAFNNCQTIYGDINLPKLTKMDNRLFCGSGISGIADLGEANNTGFNAFSKTKVAKVIFSPKINTIDAMLFDSCTELEYVEFQCEEDMTVNYNFLIGCNNLNTLIMRSPNAVVTDDAFFMYNVPDTCNIYVPDESVEQYKVATGWSTRASQIKPLSEYVPEA